MNKNSNSYRRIATVGSNVYAPVDNPLSYCMGTQMDNGFLHGSSSNIIGPNSGPCQRFMTQYCAENFDGFCEAASKNTCTDFPNQGQGCGGKGDIACRGLNLGEALIRNVAAERFLIQMANCHKTFEPFDPTVPNSPMVASWKSDVCGYSNACVPVYAVDPETIDNDDVMNKVLQNPRIAEDILVNIYNTMKRMGTLGRLKGTKLGRFYDSIIRQGDPKSGCAGNNAYNQQQHHQRQAQHMHQHPQAVHVQQTR